MHTLKLLMIVLPWNYYAITGEFTRYPENVTQVEGLNAVFFCQHPNATIVAWIVNGTSINNNLPDNITFVTMPDNGGTVHMLTITAVSEYNGTIIQCLAIIRRQGSPSMRDLSFEVALKIQGPLDSVSNLTSTSTSNSITITWDPPFSLDLTTADPDIAYCVDVFNITSDGQREMIVSDCSVLQPQYIFTVDLPEPSNLFEFTVTPRSNVEGANNGTTSEPVERYFLGIPLSPANIVIDFKINPLMIQVIILSMGAFPGRGFKPESYSIGVRVIDGKGDIPEIDTLVDVEDCGNQTKLTIVDPLVIGRHRLCLVRIIAINGAGIGTSDEIELSTHDVQDIEVNSCCNPGQVTIHCSFVNSSEDTGFFVVVYSLTRDSNIVYQVAERDPLQVTISTTIDLISDEYSVSIFDMDDKGLPQNNSAGIPKRVTVHHDSVKEQVTSTTSSSMIINVLTLDSGHLCINCTFPNSSTTSCVSIIHSTTAHMTSPYGLLNITVNEHLNKDGSVFECLPLPPDDYHVAVFGYRNGQMESTPVNVTMVTVTRQTTEPTSRIVTVYKSNEDRGDLLVIVAVLSSVCVISVTGICLSITFLMVHCTKRKVTKGDMTFCTQLHTSNVDNFSSISRFINFIDKKGDNKIELRKCDAYNAVHVFTHQRHNTSALPDYEEVDQDLIQISHGGHGIPVIYDRVVPDSNRAMLQGNVSYASINQLTN